MFNELLWYFSIWYDTEDSPCILHMDPLIGLHREIGVEELIRNYLFEAWWMNILQWNVLKLCRSPFSKYPLLKLRYGQWYIEMVWNLKWILKSQTIVQHSVVCLTSVFMASTGSATVQRKRLWNLCIAFYRVFSERSAQSAITVWRLVSKIWSNVKASENLWSDLYTTTEG
jgi:hypothetical protein